MKILFLAMVIVMGIIGYPKKASAQSAKDNNGYSYQIEELVPDNIYNLSLEHNYRDTSIIRMPKLYEGLNDTYRKALLEVNKKYKILSVTPYNFLNINWRNLAIEFTVIVELRK